MRIRIKISKIKKSTEAMKKIIKKVLKKWKNE